MPPSVESTASAPLFSEAEVELVETACTWLDPGISLRTFANSSLDVGDYKQLRRFVLQRMRARLFGLLLAKKIEDAIADLAPYRSSSSVQQELPEILDLFEPRAEPATLATLAAISTRGNIQLERLLEEVESMMPASESA